MNNQEFQLWWDHAVVVMPSLADWAKKINKHPDKDWKKVIRYWSHRMKNIGLTEAKDAMEKLPPRTQYEKADEYYERIPARISDMLATPSTMSPSINSVQEDRIFYRVVKAARKEKLDDATIRERLLAAGLSEKFVSEEF